ncbi:hypothetical protein AU074_02730 [Pseudomonas sp. ATCC PTA-122608]|nr:hypothetical protein AU074_02730 [Pseudomonas sp. ATCC PTA-122608]
MEEAASGTDAAPVVVRVPDRDEGQVVALDTDADQARGAALAEDGAAGAAPGVVASDGVRAWGAAPA